jgi:hypothetical protein
MVPERLAPSANPDIDFARDGTVRLAQRSIAFECAVMVLFQSGSGTD